MPAHVALERNQNTIELSQMLFHPTVINSPNPKCRTMPRKAEGVYFVEDEYFVTALVPSETACLASSPGRISRTLRPVSRRTTCQGDRLFCDLRGLDLS